jgi:hypothetical protein
VIKTELLHQIKAAEAALGGHSNVEEGNAKRRNYNDVGFRLVDDGGGSGCVGSR